MGKLHKITDPRRWLSAVAMGVLCAVSAGVQAQDDYPSRPVTLVAPTAAGGGVDIVARTLAEALGPELGQTLIVTNKPGAGGLIGTQSVMRERNDGYTLLITANNNQLILPWLYKQPPFDPIHDFEPIATVGSLPVVLTVNPEFPAKDLAQFLQMIKSKPGEYRFASAGIGTLNQMLPELLALKTGTKMEHVPYRGVAPAMSDVMGGQVPILFGSLPSMLENIKTGHLRALGIASAERSPLLPDVPAIGEQVPGYKSEMWVAVYAPKGTPAPVVAKLSEAVAKAVRNPRLRDSFEKMGMTVLEEGPAALAARQAEEVKMWRDVVTSAGISAER